MITTPVEHTILNATQADAMDFVERIQTLWSGYGQIFKAVLHGMPNVANCLPVVVKHVKWPTQRHHPTGWVSDFSHQRKVRSYEVECAFYTRYAAQCDADCRVPRLIAIEPHEDELLIVLEDLDAAGFPLRKYRLSMREIELTLKWLAHFHGAFLGVEPGGLWPIGTYWHLDTRPDELAQMGDGPLRQAAGKIDAMLNRATFQTLVHGDAKVANFCYGRGGKNVAAVDFQYVGGGCGMKDVAYFLGSCLHEDECERRESQLLDWYFSCLKHAVTVYGKTVAFSRLESEWRELYHLAWVDFYRFIRGWTVENRASDDYSERLTRKVLDTLSKRDGL